MGSALVTKSIRQLRTGWLEYGPKDAPLLLFLHGYPDTPDSWQYQIDHFKEKYHVIAPYTRGARPSEQSAKLNRYSLNSTALDLLEVLRQVDPTQKKPIFCIGHDMGTPQAWRLAPLLGDRLKGLIIINGLSAHQLLRRLGSLTQLKKSYYMALFMAAPITDRLLKRFPAKMIQMAHSKGALSVKMRPKLSTSLFGVIHPIRQYRAILQELIKEAMHKPHRISNPVLVIFGDKDAFLKLPTKEEMLSVAKNFEIRIIPGNHWIHREKSEEINNLLEEFICQSLAN